MLGNMAGKFFSSWFKNKNGTTAVEFSLLVIPYIFLSVAIIEVSVMYASASLLEGATGSAARMIRTGELQQSQAGNQEALFRNAVCNYASALINCDDIIIEVQPMADFSDFESMTQQYDSDGNPISQGFNPGGSSTKVMVRVSYRYHMMTPLVGPLLAGPNNTRLFVSTIVLETEPYEFQGA
jgi:Flp pilus assembly protein TadG